ESQRLVPQFGVTEPVTALALSGLRHSPQQILGAVVCGVAPLGDEPVDQRKEACDLDPALARARGEAEPARHRDEVEQAVTPGVLAEPVQHRIDVAVIGGEYP